MFSFYFKISIVPRVLYLQNKAEVVASNNHISWLIN